MLLGGTAELYMHFLLQGQHETRLLHVESLPRSAATDVGAAQDQGQQQRLREEDAPGLDGLAIGTLRCAGLAAPRGNIDVLVRAILCGAPGDSADRADGARPSLRKHLPQLPQPPGRIFDLPRLPTADADAT